jgi:hypothetical protein
VPLREFVVSPGFVGVAAVVAALIVLGAALYAVRRAGKRLDQELEQRERHHQEVRDAEQHGVASAQCWQTFKWLVDTAGVEPAAGEGATLGLGPELAMATLRGLLRDAERLKDETLADAVTAYQGQFALILAQQGGPLSELAGGAPPPPPAERKPQPQAAQKEPPAKAAEGAPDKKPAPDESQESASEMAGDGRRHRR